MEEATKTRAIDNLINNFIPFSLECFFDLHDLQQFIIFHSSNLFLSSPNHEKGEEGDGKQRKCNKEGVSAVKRAEQQLS